jgi:hypothetical protein
LTLCTGGDEAKSIIPLSILVRHGNFSESNRLNITLDLDRASRNLGDL